MSEPTLKDVLQAIERIGEKIDEVEEKLSKKIDQVEQAVGELNEDRSDIDYLKDRLQQQDISIWRVTKLYQELKQSSK